MRAARLFASGLLGLLGGGAHRERQVRRRPRRPPASKPGQRRGAPRWFVRGLVEARTGRRDGDSRRLGPVAKLRAAKLRAARERKWWLGRLRAQRREAAAIGRQLARIARDQASGVERFPIWYGGELRELPAAVLVAELERRRGALLEAAGELAAVLEEVA